MKATRKIDTLKYEFEKELKKIQLSKEMSTIEFAEYIGMHRSWLLKLYSNSEPRHPLSEKTMSKLNQRVGISYDIMLDYNDKILSEREG